MNTTAAKQAIRRQEYRKPAYWIRETQLDFDILDNVVRVNAKLWLQAEDPAAKAPLTLDGCGLRTKAVLVNDRTLSPDEYAATDTTLTIPEVPAEFLLETQVEIDPWNNLSLEGLYKSGKILCTQNEAEGFRRITWYADRPDVMSVFTTTIRADRARYPLLLSNGNPVASGDLGGGRHFATWQDPFPKPCYLFALVAGDLDRVEDSFTTKSGRKVKLHIFVDKGNTPRCGHAMASLKNSMRWDEERFGLEYDLDLFMLVAVNDFNAGAMENKGLNIFNSAYVLADPATATDADYLGIESVVGHEYFHNWTGDRVTCRDWFQLTLKEGLTVFRDHAFSSDMNSEPVKRIDDVRNLREVQFPEDAGPNSHPIRPEAYVEINNFYTSTVYQKGSEVIRMIETLIGREAFRRGMANYFELFDGQAVTCEDFVHAMELASGADLAQFRRWYSQAGTPRCRVSGTYDAASKSYRLTVRQECAPSADGSPKEPFFFPMALGLIGPDGKDLPLSLGAPVPSPASGCSLEKAAPTTLVLPISAPEQSFTFTDLPAAPLPSLFRGFSAPVNVEFAYSQADLIRLLACDSDPFNRYDAGQRLATLCLEGMMGASTGAPASCRLPPGLPPGAQPSENRARRDAVAQAGGTPTLPSMLTQTAEAVAPAALDAFGTLLADDAPDRAFCAKALVPPTLNALTQGKNPCDFHAAFAARERFMEAFAARFEGRLLELYNRYRSPEYRTDGKSVGERAFRNLCLSYLSYLGGDYAKLAYRQFQEAHNMTDSLGALNVLAQLDCPERETALAEFRAKWQGDFNVMNKWFAVQAGSKRAGVLGDVQRLMADPAFDPKNPNRLRALYGAFGRNYIHFHAADGSGYAFLAERILELDTFNPHVSAAFAKLFDKYAVLDGARQALARPQLERIIGTTGVSAGLAEIVSKTLASGT